MKLLSAETFKDEMTNTVEPMLNSIHSCGIMPRRETGEGCGIYYDIYKPLNATAAIVISHGFSESAEKFKEVIYYMVQMGYEVYAVDHRGHGRSFRQSHHPNLVFINSFNDYVEDLHDFVSLVVKTETKLPLYLFGHSMGGAVAAIYIEKYPSDFKKAILTSPMLKLKLPIPELITRIYSGAICLVGKGDTFGPMQEPYKGYESFEGSSASNEARFDYYQSKKASTEEFQLCALSYGWLYHSVTAIAKARSKRACSRITIPVLVLICNDDALIDRSGPEQFVNNTESASLSVFSECRHEIYNSDDGVIAEYYKKIFDFLAD